MRGGKRRRRKRGGVKERKTAMMATQEAVPIKAPYASGQAFLVPSAAYWRRRERKKSGKRGN
jgi:hypothetical protein